MKEVGRSLVHALLAPRRLVKTLTTLMPAAGQGRTVLALDGQWLKLLQVEGIGPARRITKLLARPVEGADAAQLRKTFLEACETEGVAPRETLIATPAHLSTVRLFTLPSTNPNEIRDIVELQVEKHTPYAKEEILSDFSVLERDRAGYSRVLLLITHQDVVHRPVRLVESCGFPLDRVGSELEGVIAWCHLVRRELGKPQGDATELVIDIDASTATVLVMQRGHLLLHRSLAAGAEQLQNDPAHAVERLVAEVQRSVEACEADGGAKLQDVLLTGRLERLEPLKLALEKQLGVAVTLVPPWGTAALPESVRAMVDRMPDVSFAGLYGLATGASSLDLTPQTTRLRHAFEAKAKSLIVLGCQGVAALIMVCLLMISRAHKEHAYYQKLRAAYAATVQDAGDMETTLRDIALIKDRLQRRGELLAAVQTLASHVPEGVQWRSIAYERGERLVLKGSSDALPRIYEFVASLDAVPTFGKVETRRVAKRKTGEEGLTDFEIACPLTLDEHPEPEEPAG